MLGRHGRGQDLLDDRGRRRRDDRPPRVRQPEPLRTGLGVIFAGEDPEYLEKSRLAVLETHYGVTLDRVFTVDGAFPVTDADLAEKMCEEMTRIEKQTGEKIVIAMNDTLKRSIGAMPQNAGETGMMFTTAMETVIRRFGCTILVNAHQPKSGAEGKIAGTGTFIDNAPVTAHLRDISPGKELSEIICDFEPKFRIGPKPKPFVVKAIAVPLAQPVAGFSSDLVFQALEPAEAAQRAAQHHKEVNADTREMRRVIFEEGAHTRETGLWTPRFAELLTGAVNLYKDENAYRVKVEEWKRKLNSGANPRKQRSGKKSPAKFEGWFEKDMIDGKGEVRWFLPKLEEAENIPLQ